MIILNIFDKFIYSITQYMFFSLNLVEILEELGKRMPIIISLLMYPLFIIIFAISQINLHLANLFVGFGLGFSAWVAANPRGSAYHVDLYQGKSESTNKHKDNLGVGS